jgi:hypothetical protein
MRGEYLECCWVNLAVVQPPNCRHAAYSSDKTPLIIRIGHLQVTDGMTRCFADRTMLAIRRALTSIWPTGTHKATELDAFQTVQKRQLLKCERAASLRVPLVLQHLEMPDRAARGAPGHLPWCSPSCVYHNMACILEARNNVQRGRWGGVP